MRNREWVMIRDVSPSECSWLENTLHKGLTVYEYYGATYGCVAGSGIAVTLVEDETPFMEVPMNSVKKNV